ncbi:MAG TPA: carboxypeptidase-like regulatory domain-containing protein, partial [Thermoanaerobaculia bacterium]|nr:carboxypeptidase-like regulatory domain-containing protein [Thermoanaerobaculia bacterium]
MFALLFLLATLTANTGTIEGVVTYDGNPVPGVDVILTNVGQASACPGECDRLKPVLHTDANGRFRFANIAPGTYTIDFAFEGFIPLRRMVTVQAGNTYSIDGTLRIATVEESITVTASAPVVLET